MKNRTFKEGNFIIGILLSDDFKGISMMYKFNDAGEESLKS